MMFLSALIQGQGLRPASRLLRGLALRPPSGRHGGAGGRLEDRERWGWGVGVRVGAEDESEAVGDAQQVGFSPSTTGRARTSTNAFNERWMVFSVAAAGTLSDMYASTPTPWSQPTSLTTSHREGPVSQTMTSQLTAGRYRLPSGHKTPQQEEQKCSICTLKREFAAFGWKMFVSTVEKNPKWLLSGSSRQSPLLTPPHATTNCCFGSHCLSGEAMGGELWFCVTLSMPSWFTRAGFFD